jgi:hypothetical protein
MTKDDQRVLLIAHALSGASHRTSASPADLARRAVDIASAALELVRREEDDERQKARLVDPRAASADAAVVPKH